MKIWVDADGCPLVVKEIVYRAAQRCEVPVVLVANRVLNHPASKWITSIVVGAGLDVADDWIAENVAPNDLVVTADIPLAARVVAARAIGIDPRGELYSAENVRERLSVRNFMHDLREQGIQTSGAATFGPKDKQRFANTLDRILARRVV